MPESKQAPEGWLSLSDIAKGPIPDGRLHSNLMNADWQAIFRLCVGSAFQSQRVLMEGLLTECTPIDEIKEAYGFAVVSLHGLRVFLVETATSAEHHGYYGGPPEIKRSYLLACRMFAVGAKKEAESGRDAYPIRTLALINAILEGADTVKAAKDAEELVALVVKQTAPKSDGVDATRPRLVFDAETWTVALDGKEHRVENPRAFKIFKVVADANGDFVPSGTIRIKVPGCNENTRIDKILSDNLPSPLRKLVKGQTGRNSGYALKLPKKPVRNGAQ